MRSTCSQSPRFLTICLILFQISISPAILAQTEEESFPVFLTLRADQCNNQPEIYVELLVPISKIGIYFRPNNSTERAQVDMAFCGPFNFDIPWRFGASITFSESEFPRWIKQNKEDFNGQAHFLIQFQKKTSRLYLPINLYYPLAKVSYGNHWTWRARIDDFHYLLSDGGRTKFYLASIAEFREGKSPKIAGGIRIDRGPLFIRAMAGTENVYSIGYSIEISGIGE